MVHSVSGWTRGVQVKLWDPLRTRAIPERLKGVFTKRHYTNTRLPLPLPLPQCGTVWHMLCTTTSQWTRLNCGWKLISLDGDEHHPATLWRFCNSRVKCHVLLTYLLCVYVFVTCVCLRYSGCVCVCLDCWCAMDPCDLMQINNNNTTATYLLQKSALWACRKSPPPPPQQAQTVH